MRFAELIFSARDFSKNMEFGVPSIQSKGKSLVLRRFAPEFYAGIRRRYALTTMTEFRWICSLKKQRHQTKNYCFDYHELHQRIASTNSVAGRSQSVKKR